MVTRLASARWTQSARTERNGAEAALATEVAAFTAVTLKSRVHITGGLHGPSGHVLGDLPDAITKHVVVQLHHQLFDLVGEHLCRFWEGVKHVTMQEAPTAVLVLRFASAQRLRAVEDALLQGATLDPFLLGVAQVAAPGDRLHDVAAERGHAVDDVACLP